MQLNASQLSTSTASTNTLTPFPTMPFSAPFKKTAKCASQPPVCATRDGREEGRIERGWMDGWIMDGWMDGDTREGKGRQSIQPGLCWYGPVTVQ